MSGNGYRTISETADELDVSVQKVRRLIRGKWLRAFQPHKGAHIKIRVEDIQDFLKRSDTTRQSTRR